MLEQEPKIQNREEEAGRVIEDNFKSAKRHIKNLFGINYEDLHLRAKKSLWENIKIATLRERKERKQFEEHETKSMSMGDAWDEGVWWWVADEYGIPLFEMLGHWNVPDEEAMAKADTEDDTLGRLVGSSRSFVNKTEAYIAAKKNKIWCTPQWYLSEDDQKIAAEYVRRVISRSQMPEL